MHLANWPITDASLIDVTLNHEMQLVPACRLARRSARSGAGIKVRQPLASVSVAVRTPQDAQAVERHRDTIAEELNVKSVTLADAEADAQRYTIKPNLRVLGPRIGKQIPALRAALGNLSPELAAQIAQAAEAGQLVEIEGSELHPPTC